MEDRDYVRAKFLKATEGYPMTQWDGIYWPIMGIPGFRLVSYLGRKAAWKAAREFVDTGVQHACGRVVRK